MTFKMNKKRNSGMVYEFLVRRLGSQLVDKDKDGADRTVSITERYFSDGEPLAEELELFRAIKETRGVSKETARRILEEVSTQARRQNFRKLDIKKSNLIKEINVTFGRDFFDKHRLPEYRLLGAIQIYIDSRRGKVLSENFQAIQLEEDMIRWMTSVPSKANSQIDEKVDDLVCVMASRSFNEKYGSSLNSNQKLLLQSYVNSLVKENSDGIRKKLDEDRRSIAKVLVDSYRLKEVQEDRVMKQRYVEAARRLSEMDTTRCDESVVEEMMLFHKLAEELLSNE